LRDKLANWERFIHEQRDIDPLIRMAVAHYQFEAIHPFTDGNGRTGRVLNLLMLVEQKLLDHPVLYLSRYIIERKADYYRLLLAVTRDGAWIEWVAYMLDAIADTARWTSAKIDAIRQLHEQACDWTRTQRPKVYSWWTCCSPSSIAASTTSSTPASPSAKPPRATCASWWTSACCRNSAWARKNCFSTPPTCGCCPVAIITCRFMRRVTPCAQAGGHD